jgi:cobalt-zinc-cadmium efflux system protein
LDFKKEHFLSQHHGHDHSRKSVQSFNRPFAISVFANLGFTLIEVVFAIMAHSASLLADAAHNLGDVLGLIFAWIASWLLTRKAKEKYSYGYKRMTIYASLSNALILFATGGIILVEAIQRLLHPAPVTELIVMMVAAVGILVNGGTALLFIKGDKKDLNIKGAFLHLAYDALISVGVVIAGCIIYFTNWYWVDPVAALIIVVLMVWGTWGLLRDSVDMSLDAVPPSVDSEQVKAFLNAFPGVVGFHHLHIWGLSTQETALTVHLTVSEVPFSNSKLKTLHDALDEKFDIAHVTVQLESEEKGSPACILSGEEDGE